MKELDRKDTPEVSGGIVGPVNLPIDSIAPILGPIVGIPGPTFPPNPTVNEQPAIETYRT